MRMEDYFSEALYQTEEIKYVIGHLDRNMLSFSVLSMYLKVGHACSGGLY